MKKYMLIFILPLLLLYGCSDPSNYEYNKGQTVDISRLNGIVYSKTIEYYVSDNEERGVRQGDPYNVFTLQKHATNSNSSSKVTFRCVPAEIFDAIHVGQELPTQRITRYDEFFEIKGRIVDRKANLNERVFHLVVKKNETYSVHRVYIETYYRLQEIRHLPLDPEP